MHIYSHHAIGSQPPLAALPIVLHQAGAITVPVIHDYSRGIAVYLKPFTHQSTVSPQNTPMQELKRTCIVLTLKHKMEICKIKKSEIA
jgi:hypothetical protein